MVDNGLPRSITKCFISNVESYAFMTRRDWQPSGTFAVFVSTTGCPDLSCEGGVDVVGVVTPLGGVAQAFHGDQVVELKYSSQCRRWKEKKKTGKDRWK